MINFLYNILGRQTERKNILCPFSNRNRFGDLGCYWDFSFGGIHERHKNRD